MKLLELDEFTSDTIIELITSSLGESINIEFKSADALKKEPATKKEISKDISAFANSDGGIIFYGINEENHIANSYSFIDGTIYTKEWLENVIISNIQTKIENLKIFPVRFDNDIKKTIYVVKIPQSNLAPHINGDKKYYRRFNFQSVPMEEYEIRNLYLRQRESKVFVNKVLIKPVFDSEEDYYSFYIEVQIINDGNYVSERYKIACNIKDAYGANISFDTPKNYNFTNKSELGIKISTNEIIPLFPYEIFSALCFKIEIPKDKFEKIVANIKCTFLVFNVTEMSEDEFNLSEFLIKIKEEYYQ
jgi:predicted HTH transcriptional regulator